MFPILLLILTFFILYFFWTNYLKDVLYIRKCLSNIPGPPQNFLVGNFLDFKPTFLHVEFLKLFKKYGPIFRIYLGYHVIIPNDPNLCEYILKEYKNINKMAHYEYTYKFLGQALLTAKDENWKKLRKIITPAFSYAHLQNFVSIFTKQSDILLKILKSEKNPNSFDITKYIQPCTLDIICEAAMGIQMHSQEDGDNEYIKHLHEICQIFSNRTSTVTKFFNLSYFFTEDYKNEKKSLKVLYEYTDQVIRQKNEERKKHKLNGKADKNEKHKIFLDILLDHSENVEPLTNEQIRFEVHTFLFAGHDTTSIGISYAIYCLSQNPEIQEEAYQEVLETFNGLGDKDIELSDLNEMKYLDAVFKETLRLYPPVPIYGRRITDEIRYENYVIPKGVEILISPYVMHRDPNIFEDPLKFDPTRFLNGNNPKTYSYLPFSQGPRNCVGNRFAMYQAKVILSKILLNFEILPSDIPFELETGSTIILSPKNGIYVKFKPRESSHI